MEKQTLETIAKTAKVAGQLCLYGGIMALGGYIGHNIQEHTGHQGTFLGMYDFTLGGLTVGSIVASLIQDGHSNDPGYDGPSAD